MLALGIRQSFGLYLPPMTLDLGWGRETFAFAIALQNLVWGLAQPFAGAIADRYGAGRVLAVGGACYAGGLALMALATSGAEFALTAGLLVGLGLSGTSFGVVMGVVGRAFDDRSRSAALGIVGAGGSFGQFVMLPYGQFLIESLGWQWALSVMALSSALIVPLAAALAGRPAGFGAGGALNFSQALAEARGHRGFWYLTLSFLVCGFQTLFIMLHLPAYLLDRGMTAATGMTALALVGALNILGSYAFGVLGNRRSKKNLLATIYLVRAATIGVFLLVPVTALSVYVFAAVMGFTWLGTVPLTNGLVAQIFGVNFLSTLFGIAFLGHQVGSFLGAWYGGYIFDLTGSYQAVWLFAIGLSLVAAGLCWPIDERRIERARAPAEA
ncbi:MAG: MFS transporter [Burkholderiales bacterium]|nr:MAG: MFS transporter [Burkholderiales bacterium]